MALLHKIWLVKLFGLPTPDLGQAIDCKIFMLKKSRKWHEENHLYNFTCERFDSKNAIKSKRTFAPSCRNKYKSYKLPDVWAFCSVKVRFLLRGLHLKVILIASS